MKDFLMATIGGIGISFICTGPYAILIILLMKEMEKKDKND